MTSLRVVAGGKSGAPAPGRTRGPLPPAPASPGPLPFSLSRCVEHGEAVLWWGEHARVDWRPVVWTGLVGALVLGALSLAVPSLWTGPGLGYPAWLRPLLPVLLPPLVMWLRERANLRAIIVTDLAVIECAPSGAFDRLGYRGIRQVRRDAFTGAIVLSGVAHRVRISPVLADDARAAIARPLAAMVRAAHEAPDDPLGWLPG